MAIVQSHHLLIYTFGILGNIISFFVYLAPVPTFYRIWRKKSTEGFHSLPYLVALFSAMLWLYYALLKKNALLLITINSFGCVIEFLYFILFIAYATKPARKLTIKIFAVMNMGLFALILLFIQFVSKGSYRVEIMGWVCVAVSVSVFAAPLSIVAQVIRTRSVEFMPFTLSFFLTLSAIMWFAYGLFLKDICIAIPNIVGFILGLLQMLLYGVYRKSSKVVVTKEKLPEQVKTSMATLGNCAAEVYPVFDGKLNANGNDAEKALKECEETTANDEQSHECAV